MDLKKYRHYAPVLLRVGIAIVFLWFGFNEVLNPDAWTAFAPDFLTQFASAKTFVLISGTFEIVFGGLLLIGLFTRLASILLAIHLVTIIMSLGYNDIAVRDFGLLIATLSIILNGPDIWCLDKRLKKK